MQQVTPITGTAIACKSGGSVMEENAHSKESLVLKRRSAPLLQAVAPSGKRRRSELPAESIPRPLRSRKSLDNLQAATQARAVLEGLRTVVISLDRRPDRMVGCSQRLALRCPELQHEKLSATDGKNTVIPEEEVATSWHTARNVVYQKQRSIRKGWDDLHTYQERRLALSPGERGCASSHIRAWRQCLEMAGGSEQPLLVLEDDAAPTAEFSRILTSALANLPSDAGLLYLGYSQAADWRREVSPELVESEYVWTTVAYIVWPACARKMLSKLPINEPVDNWMAGLAAEGELKAYCVRPKIVLQADAWNVNSDVAHSDEHYWGPCSDVLHSDAFYWGAEDPRGEVDRQAIAGPFSGMGDSDSDEESDA